MTAEQPGVRAAAVSDWLARRLPDAAPPFAFARLPGGNSNLTYRAEDRAGRAVVLRRGPVGRTLPTAHDMLREARVLTALRGGGLPVPAVYAVCDDPEVTGAPFFVMEYVDGIVCAGRRQAADLTGAQRTRAGESLAETLGALHRLDPDRVGLGDLGRRSGYVERQLARWHAQWTAGRLRVLPAIDAAHALLAARVPAQRATGVVHGDFRLDNCVLAPDGAVRAVLDWEICALGDPLADLGVLLAYWAEPGDRVSALQDPPTLAGGFPGRDRMLAAYLAATGAPSGEHGAIRASVPYYIAFAWWKLACIVEGVYTRTAQGAAPAAGRDEAGYARQAQRLADHALKLAAALPGG